VEEPPVQLLWVVGAARLVTAPDEYGVSCPPVDPAEMAGQGGQAPPWASGHRGRGVGTTNQLGKGSGLGFQHIEVGERLHLAEDTETPATGSERDPRDGRSRRQRSRGLVSIAATDGWAEVGLVDRTARRVVVTAPGRVEVADVAVPDLGSGDVLVAMLAAGICGSDTHAAKGRHPFIGFPYAPGHEVVGRVAAVGDAVSLHVGQRVVVEPLGACGHCQYCRDGRYNLCLNLVFFGCGSPVGGMAEYFVLPAAQLHPVPAELTVEQAVLVEPLACPVHAVRLAGDLRGRSVVVIGAGTIGLLTSAVARDAGAARVAVLDRSAARRDRARRLGADVTHDSGSPEAAAAVRREFGRSADVVFDCLATQSSLDHAVTMALNGGTVVVVGVPEGPMTLPLPQIQDAQVRVQGSATYVAADFEQSLSLLSRGVVRADDVVTGRYPLERAAAAFEDAGSGRHVKVVLLPRDDEGDR